MSRSEIINSPYLGVCLGIVESPHLHKASKPTLRFIFSRYKKLSLKKEPKKQTETTRSLERGQRKRNSSPPPCWTRDTDFEIGGWPVDVAYTTKARDASKPGTRENQFGSSSPGCSCTGWRWRSHRSPGRQGCVLFGQGQGRWLALPSSEGEIAISRTGVARGKCSRGHGRSARSNQPFLALVGIDAKTGSKGIQKSRQGEEDRHWSDVPTNFV